MTDKTNVMEIFQRVQEILNARKRLGSEETSYVASLYDKGTDAILRKISEECTETLLAAKSSDRAHLVQEITDLWFHCMVLMAHLQLSVDDIAAEMQRREGISGIQVKAARSKPVH